MAFFGQKDAQQVIIIKKMVKDLNVPVEIIQCPIVREESGLALSSRNKYLSEDGKVEALVLSKILNNIKACYKRGINDVSALKETAYSYSTYDLWLTAKDSCSRQRMYRSAEKQLVIE